MHSQESLSLLQRFISTRDPFSNSRWLTGKFCPVIGILGCVMNRLWDELSMCHAIASQLVRHYFPGFRLMILQHPLEKALGSLAVSSGLQKHIDYLSILVNRAPQIQLLAADLHEHFINEKCIAETWMPTLQTLGILRSKLVTPQANRFITDENTSFSQQIFYIPMTEIESMIEPNCILNNVRREPVAFVP